MEKYILVVDDDPSIRRMLQAVLHNSGYTSKTAANSAECLIAVRSPDTPTLILLDYKMPGMNGLEALSILKKDISTQDIPVVMISAEENLKEPALQQGANAVLGKPLDINILVETIGELL